MSEFIFCVLAILLFCGFAAVVAILWEQHEKKVALKRPINYGSKRVFKRGER